MVTPDCPHQESAAALLRTALDDVGLIGPEFKTTVIATADDAHRLGFRGSPTILVNGQDPFAVPGAQPALRLPAVFQAHRPDRHPTIGRPRQALKRGAAAVR